MEWNRSGEALGEEWSGSSLPCAPDLRLLTYQMSTRQRPACCPHGAAVRVPTESDLNPNRRLGWEGRAAALVWGWETGGGAHTD